MSLIQVSKAALAFRFASLLTFGWLLSTTAAAQSTAIPAPRPMASLKNVQVPLPSNLDDFVKDREAAIMLGKALFWDMQVGSDGKTACASCHWHAGADVRFVNTLAPAKALRSSQPLSDPLAKLTRSSFPFIKRANPDPSDPTDPYLNPNSVIVSRNDEVLEVKAFSSVTIMASVHGAPLSWANRATTRLSASMEPTCERSPVAIHHR